MTLSSSETELRRDINTKIIRTIKKDPKSGYLCVCKCSEDHYMCHTGAVLEEVFRPFTEVKAVIPQCRKVLIMQKSPFQNNT